jgi:DNA-binding winged helix-turn-helix (wHTH) protein/TolB-like protein
MVRFGTFDFDPETGELHRNGTGGRAGVVRLERQPARALALLVGRAGEVVSRDQLKTALWGDDTHVDFDRGIAYAISQIRTALGDSAENPRFIETLPKRGFRFIAPVGGDDVREVPGAKAPGLRREGTGRPRYRWLGVAGVVALALVVAAFWFANQRPVVAVAVFDNETGNPAHDAFTSGLSDAVVAHLGQIDRARLGVVGNTVQVRMPRSERDLNAILEETGAGYVLLAQFQVTDTGLRLFAHLIRLSDGQHVWVKRFDRSAEPGGLSGLEAEVLADVERGVRTHVMGDTSSASPPPATR